MTTVSSTSPAAEPPPRLELGSETYTWSELGPIESTSRSWAHHGIVVVSDGSVVTAHPDGNALVIFPAGGTTATATVPVPVGEMHGLTATVEDGRDLIWIADNGHKYMPAQPEYSERTTVGQVVQVSLDGQIVRTLTPPRVAGDSDGAWWSPTAVAADPADDGGSGNVWVADGYGHGLVHCFDRDGQLLYTLDGTESDLRFDVPHGIVVDRRHINPELVVADRSNQRLVYYTLGGDYVRTVGEGQLTSPSGLAVDADRLLVTELFGGVVAFDDAYHRCGQIPQAPGHGRPGWPNQIVDGTTVRPDVTPGVLNSPHGIAVDSDGNIYLTEWFIGGRITKLTPAGLKAHPSPADQSGSGPTHVVHNFPPA
jgi:hypothetical protein